MTQLSALTWPDVPADALLVIAVGSVEQHGPHLPLDTDTRVADAVARSLVAVTPGAVHGPPVAYGSSGEHQAFAGTVSIGTDALAMLLVELGRSAACWAPKVLLLNGHGGNAVALSRAVTQLRGEGRDAAWWPCAVPATPRHPADAHAGRTETSLLLHLAPEVVAAELAEAGERRPVAELLPQLRSGGVRALSGNGVLGDPAGASAAEGADLFAALVSRAHAAVARWSPGAHGMLG